MNVLNSIYYFFCKRRNVRAIFDIDDFTCEESNPDDPLLCNNYELHLKLPDGNNITDEDIKNIENIYNKINTKKINKYIYKNDTFTDKNDTSHKFCITKLLHLSYTKHCIYIPGNNDYFYNFSMGKYFYDNGYNFYAISFPNNGFVSQISNKYHSTFSDINTLYKYIDYIISYYNIQTVDILIGHSTGGLIATCYTAYKNEKNTVIKQLILSSPLLAWMDDKTGGFSYYTKKVIQYIMMPLGTIVPLLNVKAKTGKPNFTTCSEFNMMNFNPNYKLLREPPIYTQWLRACMLKMLDIYDKKINTKCPVHVFCSDKSVFHTYTTNADNVIDVEDIKKYSQYISSDVKLHVIPDAIHNVLLSVNNILDYIK
jgi:alpha-beta hydrolase superfamily lysophospholipase